MTLLFDTTIEATPAYSNHAKWDCEADEVHDYVERVVRENYSCDDLIRGTPGGIAIKVTFHTDGDDDYGCSPSSTFSLVTEVADMVAFLDMYHDEPLDGTNFFIPTEAIERVRAGESADDVLTDEEKETVFDMYLAYLSWGILESEWTPHSVAYSYEEVIGQEKVVFVLPKFDRYFDWEMDKWRVTSLAQSLYADFQEALAAMSASDTLKALFAQVPRFEDRVYFGKVLNVLGIRIEVGADTLYGWYEGDDLDTKAAALTERLIKEHKENFPDLYESEEDEDDEYDDEYVDEDEVNDEVDDERDDAAHDSSPRKS